MMVVGGVRCEVGAWQSLSTAQNLHAVTRWQHPPLLDDRAAPSHPGGGGAGWMSPCKHADHTINYNGPGKECEDGGGGVLCH